MIDFNAAKKTLFEAILIYRFLFEIYNLMVFSKYKDNF